MIVQHNPIFHQLSILMNKGECFTCGIKIDRKTCKHFYGENDPDKPKPLLADYCNKCGLEKRTPQRRKPKPKPKPVQKKMRKRVATRGRNRRR